MPGLLEDIEKIEGSALGRAESAFGQAKSEVEQVKSVFGGVASALNQLGGIPDLSDTSDASGDSSDGGVRRNVAEFATFNLKLDGSTVAADLEHDILEVSVDNSLHLPDQGTVRLHCWDAQHQTFKWLDDDTLAVGKKLEILAGYGSQVSSIFIGEITGLDLDMSALATPTLLVRALDKSHRLHRGRKSRSFVQIKDSDIVSQLAGEAGLTASAVDETSGVHDWVFQNNQTDWEFLQVRARRNGFRLYVEGDGKLHFEKVKDTDTDEPAVAVTWGDSLRSFRPRISAGHQVDQVTVRGWDRQQKQVIVGTATTAQGVPMIGGQTQGGSVASGAFGSAQMHVVDQPVFSQEEANGIAQSVLDDIGGEYLEGDGLCDGAPSLKPGGMVEVKNIGVKYSGKYLVTATTHVYNSTEGYTTLFSINGKRPANLLALLDDEGGGARANMGSSIVIGIVTDNTDPDKKQGRVKVKYPWNTEDHTSDWAHLACPMAGNGRGFQFLPEVDDEVLVAFEHGDVRRPYVLGALWNGKDAPIEGNDAAVVGGKVVHRIIKTRIGHTVLLDDTDGTGEMKMTTKSGHFLTLNDRDKNITAQTKDGHKVLLDDQNGQIVVVDKTGSNKMTIKSDDNSIAIECQGNFSVKATGNVSIQAQQGIKMTTPMQFEASADAGLTMTTSAQMQLKADATMDVEATGPMTIKGAIVQIN